MQISAECVNNNKKATNISVHALEQLETQIQRKNHDKYEQQQ